MRSIASTVSVLRYARQVLSPAPTAAARRSQVASAPSRPPRLPPASPLPTLVTKKLISLSPAAPPAMELPPAIELPPAAPVAAPPPAPAAAPPPAPAAAAVEPLPPAPAEAAGWLALLLV